MNLYIKKPGVKSNHQEFLQRLDIIYPNYPFMIKDIYSNAHKKLLIEDKYGEYLISPDKLLLKRLPSIMSAIDRTQNFINRGNDIHNFKYTYEKTELIKMNNKVIITCKNHGDFKQSATSHLLGLGCAKCGNIITSLSKYGTLEQFINEANIVHNFKYDYSKSIYKGCFEKIEIICEDHDSFFQLPRRHLIGHGCPKCAREKIGYGWKKSDFVKRAKNNRAIFYILECWNDEERFYKIGITTRIMKKRYECKSQMPYSYKIVNETVDLPEKIWLLEKSYLKLYRKFKYVPKIKFSGKFECFNDELNIDELIENINKYE